jgi:cell division protein FtsW (lipid II flippase)
MDEDKKTQFKWMFYRLTVQLNIIVLLVAVSIIAFFIPVIPYRVPIIIVMLAIALILAIDFGRKYKETKVWLDAHADKKNKDKDKDAKKEDEVTDVHVTEDEG